MSFSPLSDKKLDGRKKEKKNRKRYDSNENNFFEFFPSLLMEKMNGKKIVLEFLSQKFRKVPKGFRYLEKYF